jgi:signal transduction histidine kinase
MRKARPVAAVFGTAIAMAVIFAFLAVQLANNQQRSRQQIETEVSDRAVLAGSLVDSVFQTVDQQKTQYAVDYGAATLTPNELIAAAKSNQFALVTDSRGALIAASPGYRATSVVGLTTSQLAALAGTDQSYFLGDATPYGGTQVVDLAVPFTTSFGARVLVSGIPVSALSSFFGSDLRSLPGPRGQISYILDGRGVQLGASGAGSISQAALVRTAHLGTGAVDYRGTYLQQTTLTGSHWRLLLAAPDGPLFSSVSGAHATVPWLIFAALILFAAAALVLALRVIHSARALEEVNSELAAVNDELSTANSALERRAAELARSNEELDSFASIASHDLQEPLRKVRTFTEELSLTEADNLTEKGRDYLRRANQAAERMQRLIEDLLRFSRVSTQGRPFEQVDLDEVFRRARIDLDRQIEEADARLDIGPLPVITADPLQMQQLAQNLISNAIKFARVGVTPEVSVTGEIAGDTLRLQVKDNGIGFEPRYATRIFRIFERLNGRTEYPGTGIGLALCRKIADRHGGTIEAHGEPGAGATFTVTLPLRHPEGAYGFGMDMQTHEEAKAHAGT